MVLAVTARHERHDDDAHRLLRVLDAGPRAAAADEMRWAARKRRIVR